MNSVFQRTKYTRKPLHPAKITKPKTSGKEKLIRWIVIVMFLGLSYSMGWMKVRATKITNTIAYIAGSTLGSTVQKDEDKNINVLLVGYGGGTHDGAQLADTIIVASYNTKHHSVSMIALPRDLLVLDESGKVVKINSVLSRAYNSNGRDIRAAVQKLQNTAQKITGLTIPYYAMIDFDGFINVVDSLGGIDIYVPQHFLDTQYPIERNGTYEIFELFEGWNHLSGPNTLKYVRSRHSTSDFSRSKRQQQIIQAVAYKMIGGENFNISKMSELYDYYTKTVITNLGLNELLGLAKYGTNLPTMYSFGYTTQCSNDIRRTMPAGCVLRNGKGGLLPSQLTGAVEDYSETKRFASIVAGSPAFLSEGGYITVLNATDKELAKTLPFGSSIAGKIAAKLRRYDIDVQQVTNADSVSTGTFLEIYGTGEYTHTIELMKKFVPITSVKTYPDRIDAQGVLKTGDIYLYLGDDYLNLVGNTEFDFYNTL